MQDDQEYIVGQGVWIYDTPQRVLVRQKQRAWIDYLEVEEKKLNFRGFV